MDRGGEEDKEVREGAREENDGKGRINRGRKRRKEGESSDGGKAKVLTRVGKIQSRE